jgi:hypothetical protein
MRDLRRTFRRVVWVGERPWETDALPPDRPLVLYANHHAFHDGYLLWMLIHRVLGRPMVVWMRDWERAPLFGPIGALPFPEDDPRARSATVRETVRRFRQDPRTTFLYYPEGDLRPSDAGLGPFEEGRFPRLARLFPEETLWWPVGVRLTWWGEDRPTALLTSALPHPTPDGRERERLAEALRQLEGARPGGPGRVLLEGQRSVHERWDLRPLAPLFRRWT